MLAKHQRQNIQRLLMHIPYKCEYIKMALSVLCNAKKHSQLHISFFPCYQPILKHNHNLNFKNQPTLNTTFTYFFSIPLSTKERGIIMSDNPNSHFKTQESHNLLCVSLGASESWGPLSPQSTTPPFRQDPNRAKGKSLQKTKFEIY